MSEYTYQDALEEVGGRKFPSAREELGDFFDEAREGLARARKKHGPMNGYHEGYAVLLEEVDELWDEVKAQKQDPARIVEECIQIAAMAGRIVEDLCRE